MILIFFEGIGIITGFAVGYLGKRVSSNADPVVRRKLILGFLAAVLVMLSLGFAWYALSIPEGNWTLVKDYLLGFLFLGVVGWALGTFAEGLVRKIVD